MGTFLAGLAALTLLLVLAGYAEAAHPVLELLTSFRLHLAVLSGALALVLAILRHRRGAVLALLAAVAAAAGLGPVYDALPPPGDGRSLTLFYANIHDRNQVPQALFEALHTADADILVTSDTPRAVGDRFAATYPHRLVTWNRGESRFTAIWSKYPLDNATVCLNNNVAPTGAAATVELGDGLRLGLIGAHFSRPYERLHMTQAAALLGIAEPLARPLVIAGDFNAAPWARVVARAAEVTSTSILGGYRVTWRGSYPTPLARCPNRGATRSTRSCCRRRSVSWRWRPWRCRARTIAGCSCGCGSLPRDRAPVTPSRGRRSCLC